MSVLLFLLFPLWGVLLIDGVLRLWLLAVRCWGKRIPVEVAECEAKLSIAIFIPAHNEEGVIGETVQHLRYLRYPKDRYAVIVIADGCTDGTLARAQAQGSVCLVREIAAERGKGRALAWLVTEHRALLRRFEVVLICDADSRLHPDALTFINHAFVHGCQVAQTRVAHESGASTVGAAVALPEAFSQEVDDCARMALHWPAPLRGAGMAFRPEVLERVAVQLRTKAEDLELSLLLASLGVQVNSLPEAILYDPKPHAVTGAARQRARWLQGHGEVLREYWREIGQIFSTGRWGERALLFSLLCRPRTVVIGAKMLLMCGLFWLSATLSVSVSLLLLAGASVAFLADLLYYLVGFLLLSRKETHGEMWRMILYLPIWAGAVALSIFSTKKWLSVRSKAVER